MNEWQPIETAPKDGRAVLLGHAAFVSEGYFDCVDKVHRIAGLNAVPFTLFTHWQPLPKTPSAPTAPAPQGSPVAAERREDVREALGMSEPWPLTSVLAKLVQATEHLLDEHQCDNHGHEEYRQAANRGKELGARLNAYLSGRSAAPQGEKCPACRGSTIDPASTPGRPVSCITCNGTGQQPAEAVGEAGEVRRG